MNAFAGLNLVNGERLHEMFCTSDFTFFWDMLHVTEYENCMAKTVKKAHNHDMHPKTIFFGWSLILA